MLELFIVGLFKRAKYILARKSAKMPDKVIILHLFLLQLSAV